MAGEDADSGERTEEATPQRREEFRKQGQVAMTRELGSALMLFGMSFMVWLFGRAIAQEVIQVLQQLLGSMAGTYGKTGDFTPVFKATATHLFFILAPIFLTTGLFAFAATALQVGFLTNSEAIVPNLARINPIDGFLRIMSLRSVVEGLKSMIKVGLLGLLAYIIMKPEIRTIPKVMDFSIEQLVLYFSTLTTKLFFSLGLFMVGLAVIDYAYNFWDLERRMRMTKQEIKEEVKTREGSPQIKARIRRLQREMATKRMMDALPKADVIITNPTHIAIALKYNDNLPAPQLIAKGADLIAERIKKIARELNIPIVENKPLARTVYKTIKIGQLIPRELFQAVAEILAYVYKLKKKAVT